MFVRAEGNLMDFNGVTLTNTEDSTKSIKAKDIEGYGARVSINIDKLLLRKIFAIFLLLTCASLIIEHFII